MEIPEKKTENMFEFSLVMHQKTANAGLTETRRRKSSTADPKTELLLWSRCGSSPGQRI
jgi:hypothetical protein